MGGKYLDNKTGTPGPTNQWRIREPINEKHPNWERDPMLARELLASRGCWVIWSVRACLHMPEHLGYLRQFGGNVGHFICGLDLVIGARRRWVFYGLFGYSKNERKMEFFGEKWVNIQGNFIIEGQWFNEDNFEKGIDI